MIVGVLRVQLYIRQSHSLKEKRQVLRKIKDKVSHHFNVAIAEVGENDNWKRSTLGISTVGNEAAIVHSNLDQVLKTIEGLFVAEILSQEKKLHYHKE